MSKKALLYCTLALSIFISISFEAMAQLRSIERDKLRSKDIWLAKPQGMNEIAMIPSTIQINAGEYLVERFSQKIAQSQLESGALRLELPYRLYGVDRNGVDLNLKIVVDVQGGGMNLSQDETQFEGIIQIGVLDEINPNLTRPLPNPVQMQITADIARVEPTSNFNIDHTNLPFSRLSLIAVEPKPVTLQIRSSFAQQLEEEKLSVHPVITATASPQKIEGLGIGTADITVQIESLRQKEGVGVTLDTNKGQLETTRLTLDKEGIATTKIRSVGVGVATITVRSAKAARAEIRVTFLWPWVFLLCALMGGLIGSAIRLLRSKTSHARRVIRRIIRGILIALLVNAAYAVGITLIGVSLKASAGEALNFVLAAIGSYLGKISLPRQI